jgi:hypothetical protein
MKFEKTIDFLNERLGFIELSLQNATFGNEREFKEAKRNLTIIQSAISEHTNFGNVVWDGYDNEIAYLNKFVDGCIEHLLGAINVYKSMIEEGRLDIKEQYNIAIKQLEDFYLVEEEISVFNDFQNIK